MDFCPYFAGVAGNTHNIKTDGKDILPLVKGSAPKADDRALFWHYPLRRPHFLGGRSSGAVRKGKWKLIHFFDTGDIELYDLENDISESRNLASSNAGKCRKLLKEMERFRERTGVEIPDSCRDYGPDKYFFDPLWRKFLQKVVY